jgi:hypothetical protein
MMEIYMSERVLLSPAPLAKAVDMELLRVEQRLLAHFCLPREGVEQMAAPVAVAAVTAAMGLMVVAAVAATVTAATAAPMAEAVAAAAAGELAVLAVCTGEMEEVPGKMEAPEQIRAGSGLNSRERGRADRVTPLTVVAAAGDTAVMAAIPPVAPAVAVEGTVATAVTAAAAPVAPAVAVEGTVATAVTAAMGFMVAAAGDTGHAGMAAPQERQAGLPREGMVLLLQIPLLLADRASLSSNTTHKEAP